MFRVLFRAPIIMFYNSRDLTKRRDGARLFRALWNVRFDLFLRNMKIKNSWS